MRRSLCLYGLSGIVVFCALTGKVNVFSVCLGLAAGVGGGWLLSRLRGRRAGLSPGRLIAYGFYMVREIAVSALKLTAAVFGRRECRAAIRKLPVRLTDGKDVIVSNSITLTPGTVTLEDDGTVYTVLSLETVNEKELQDSVEQLEKRLEGGRHA